MDYGYTRPNVMSRGVYDQMGGDVSSSGPPTETTEGHEPSPDEATAPPETDGGEELLPTPPAGELLDVPPTDEDTSGETDANEVQAGYVPAPFVAESELDSAEIAAGGREREWRGTRHDF
jgi:hypothetical protein